MHTLLDSITGHVQQLDFSYNTDNILLWLMHYLWFWYIYITNNTFFLYFQMFDGPSLSRQSTEEAKVCLDKLVDHYQLPKQATSLQWCAFSNKLRRPEHIKCDIQQALRLLNQQAFPNLTFLVTVGLTIPTSVSCARGISIYNDVKTDTRSNMLMTGVNNKMIYLNGPNLKSVNFDNAFDL